MANKASFKLVTDNTDKILKLTDEAIYNALEEVGNQAADLAAALAPVQTGTLKNSLTSEVHMENKEVWVGTDVEYAEAVEYGHHQQVGRYVPAIGKRLVREFVPAKPYLQPAIQNNIEKFKQIFEDELNL